MVKVKVQKQQLRHTMDRIQKQYDQIMERASETQENGIRPLCMGWQNPNAKAQIVNLVNILNEKMNKITKRYGILFDKLNGWAGETVRSGGGNWTNIAFVARTYNFSSAEARDGDNGENTLFNEELIFNGIARVKKMAKNIVKNQRDTSAIFARNNDLFGIKNDSPKVFDNFREKMEKFANDIETEVDQCIANFNLVSDEQKNRLNTILQKYSVSSLPEYSVDGWNVTKKIEGDIGFNDSSSDNVSSGDNSSNSSETISTDPVDPDGADFTSEYAE